LKAHHGNYCVKVLNGYEFSDKIHSSELFGFLNKFKKIKQDQDKYKDEKNDLYNEALREAAKLFLNSFTGKLLESPHYETIMYLQNKKDWKTAHSKLNITQYEKIGQYDVIKGMMKEDFIKYSPVHLGVTVYSYARKHMYDNVYSKIPREFQHQTDTDSVMLHESALIEFKEKYPNMFGNEFGQLDIENYTFKTFYAIRPKVYAGIGTDSSADKMRMKGVSKNATIIKFAENSKCKELFIESIKGQDQTSFEYRRAMHESDKSDKLKNNIEYAFENLVNSQPIYVIQSMFKKIGIDGCDFNKLGDINVGVTMQYPLKKIQ
jgi:hypothetical protein